MTMSASFPCPKFLFRSCLDLYSFFIVSVGKWGDSTSVVFLKARIETSQRAILSLIPNHHLMIYHCSSNFEIHAWASVVSLTWDKCMYGYQGRQMAWILSDCTQLSSGCGLLCRDLKADERLNLSATGKLSNKWGLSCEVLLLLSIYFCVWEAQTYIAVVLIK